MNIDTVLSDAVIRKGTYTPEPVVIRLIPKPGKSEKRKLEIPCPLDRMILYAIHTALSPYYESRFSKNSYGFRKNIQCRDALKSCLNYLNQGYHFIIDLDIRNFFDHIDHNLLLQRLQKDITDICLLNLIKKYMKTKVRAGRHIYQNYVGVPQGSATSPLFANIFLDSFDQHMDLQLIKYVRYADDIVIFCQTMEEAEQTLSLARNYLTETLRLTLNEEKTNILQPEQLHYLGYAFTQDSSQKYILTIDDETRNRMLEKIQKNVKRNCVTMEEWWQRLGSFHRGWVNYYKDVPPHIMIPFLQLAEQKELLYFSLKACSGKKNLSQKYISALFNCPCYSSLTGWYQHTIIKNNHNLLRRINTMKALKKTNNKPTIWRSRDFFTEKHLLEPHYKSLIEKPFYYDAHYNLEFYHYSCNIEPGTEQELDIRDLLIIGILAAGKNMTLAQLASYLLLKNTVMTTKELEETVNRLISLGIINRTTIYPQKAFFLKTENASPSYINCYQITSEGMWFANQIYAPLDFTIYNNIFSANYPSICYFYTNTILFNQIVLNYMMYSNTFIRFEITPTYYFPSCGKFIIPLYVETKDTNYFFSYTNLISEEKIHKIFYNWDNFQKNTKKETTFVLISNESEELRNAKSLLFRESLFSNDLGISNLFPDIGNNESPQKGTISNKTVFFNKIAFSVTHSWFHDNAGIIIPYRTFS